MSVDIFGIEKEFLRDLLKEVVTGLASISLGYPAGTLMMLRTGGNVRFKFRPIEGAMPLADPKTNQDPGCGPKGFAS